MAPGLSKSATLEQLNCARTKLSTVLPPHADKIVRALQHVELALQYYSIDSSSDKLVHATRIALRTLNQIENQQNLPPAVRFAVGQATDALASIVKAIRAASPMAPLRSHHDMAARRYVRPERRSGHAVGQDGNDELQLRDEDDTIDGLECLSDDFESSTDDLSPLSQNPN